MKIKRQKAVRRILAFYRNNFSCQAPYNVLVDGTFCKAALSFKVNISDQLPKYLDAEVKLFTTPCALAECEAYGQLLYGPLKVLEQYEVAACGHQPPGPAASCLHRMARKSAKGITRKFIIATQDTELSKRVRNTAGVPLLYISHHAITLEAPSIKSQQKAELETSSRLNPVAEIKALKDTVIGESKGAQQKSLRKKKKGGPNPLSCKKSKKKTVKQKGKDSQSNPGKRHRKRRSRLKVKVQQP